MRLLDKQKVFIFNWNMQSLLSIHSCHISTLQFIYSAAINKTLGHEIRSWSATMSAVDENFKISKSKSPFSNFLCQLLASGSYVVERSPSTAQIWQTRESSPLCCSFTAELLYIFVDHPNFPLITKMIEQKPQMRLWTRLSYNSKILQTNNTFHVTSTVYLQSSQSS